MNLGKTLFAQLMEFVPWTHTSLDKTARERVDTE